MGSISQFQYQQMLERTNKARGLFEWDGVESVREHQCESEIGKGGLHEQITQWCDSQWPRWRYIHARTDKRSTIGEGVHDLTVFGPHPLCFCVEAKAKGKKVSPRQREWIAEMKMLGWTVHVVYNLQEFLKVAAPGTQLKP